MRTELNGIVYWSLFVLGVTFLAAVTCAPLKRNKRWTLIVALVLGIVLAGGARAANAPDPRLDAAASEVAGHPVSVWCETDQSEWNQLQTNYGSGDASGFTQPGGSQLWLAPSSCLTLRYYLGEPDGIPMTFEGAALLTLLHEASHDEGIADEHAADCHALSIVSPYAESLLGVQPTVTTTSKHVVKKRVRIHGRWRIRRVSVLVRHIEANAALGLIQAEALAAHNAKPAAYSGPC